MGCIYKTTKHNFWNLLFSSHGEVSISISVSPLSSDGHLSGLEVVSLIYGGSQRSVAAMIYKGAGVMEAPLVVLSF